MSKPAPSQSLRGVASLWRDPQLRSVTVASLTLGAAVGVFAVSFGVTAVASGTSVAQTCALSLFVFTGASQFSAISVLGSGGSPAAAFGGAALLAARNGVYGIVLSPLLRGRLPKRLLAAHLVLDETTAMAMVRDDPAHRRAAFWITGVTLFVLWNLGTLVGALLGSAIDPTTYGLDAAFPAAYVAMLWPLLRDRRSRQAAVLGAVICLALIPFLPVGLPILCASTAILIGLPEPAARPPLREVPAS